MNPPSSWLCSQIEFGILRCASVLAPAEQRTEWLLEWRSELWHAREAIQINGDHSWRQEAQILDFCSGAIQDAFAVRRIFQQNREAHKAFHGSAAECLLILGAVLAASYLLSLVLPGARAESHPALYKVNPNLIMIQNAFASNDSLATIPVEKYRAWKSWRQRYFDGFAFYRIARESATPGAARPRRWKVAHGSMNLFWMLGLPVRFSPATGDEAGRIPGVILSDEVWQKDFGSDSQIAGKTVRIGHSQVPVIGVAPAGAWRLPGTVDAWLLEPDSVNRGVGFVIAHLTPLGAAEMQSSRVQISTSDGDESEEELYGVSFAERTKGPWGFYQFTMILAILALPAITSVSLGDSNFCSYRPSWANRLYRWMFLGVKVALLLPSVYFASLDIAYCGTTTYSIGAQYIQLIASFTMGLFGFRWILLDQRNRCPVCLRRVSHPAQVGLAGRTFLAWNGTELICAGGHTLLHVPALPTSWFSTQRWLYLDTSWKFLFAGSSAG
jgi:hypothetical protein